MSSMAMLEVKNQDPVAAIRELCRRLLDLREWSGMVVSQRLAGQVAVRPTLVVDPDHMGEVDPLAPSFPLNAAPLVAALTKGAADKEIAAVLRPCEVRALVELAKLKQADRERLFILGLDCYGAYRNLDYQRFVQEVGEPSTLQFYQARQQDSNSLELAPACRACEHPVAENVDLRLGLIGLDISKEIMLAAVSPKGGEVLERLGLEVQTGEIEARKQAVAELIAERVQFRDQMFARTLEAVSDMGGLNQYLGDCVTCLNCRVACPVCYCRECVFATDVFDYDLERYVRRARRHGGLRLPADTVFYHLTRLVHMSTACVGCGQCSNNCPNEVAVAELFRTIAHRTQAAFGYEAGRSLEEEPPMATFREEEFLELTGGKE